MDICHVYMTHTNVYNMKVEVKLLQEMKGTDWEGGKKRAQV